jgi:asparagine synthase (glutamine-hydrolysing)
MCGLIGSLKLTGSALPLSLAPLRHRGPDGDGAWFSPDHRCWLGHTRLAIQDLSEAGSQPITSHCGRMVLVFNGEIYNHLQLRSYLPLSTWRGHSDSETLVEGLAHVGPAFLSELYGMFAFAAYDIQNNELWLGRDRFGIKPLYVSSQTDGLTFASEKRALPSTHELTPQLVSQVLTFGHPTTPPRLFELPSPSSPVTSIPPGILVRINQVGQFYPLYLSNLRQQIASDDPAYLSPPPRSLSQASSILRDLLDEVISEHLLGDVPVACFLSSGLDSGILAAIASRQKYGPISTFTVALPGTPQDEGIMANQMAKHCGTHHHELIIEHDEALIWVENALALLDSPSADAINSFIISKAVANHGIKVALSGLGADELFGGYPSHRIIPLLRSLRFLPGCLRRTLLRTFTPRLECKVQDVELWDDWHLSIALRRWASNADLNSAGASPFQCPDPPPHPSFDTWGMCTWAELFGYTEPMLLRDADVMSMACGLEIRVPYLDYRIVEFALFTARRFQRPGKYLLRSAFSDLFPPRYLSREKQGFALPMKAWMLGPLRPLCRTRLEFLRDSGCLDPTWIAQQWASFEAGYLNWPRAWSLVVLGEFAYRDSTINKGESAHC